MSLADTYDVIVLGSGIAGLAAALAAHENGLKPVLVEKAEKLGGTTSDSYGLIWIGNNHLMRAEGETDRREDIVEYMNFSAAGRSMKRGCWLSSIDRLKFCCSSSVAAYRFGSRTASSITISGWRPAQGAPDVLSKPA